MDKIIYNKNYHLIGLVVVFIFLSVYKRGFKNIDTNWFIDKLFKLIIFLTIALVLGYELEIARVMALVYLISLEFLRKRKKEIFSGNEECAPIEPKLELPFSEVNKAILIFSNSLKLGNDCNKEEPIKVLFKDNTYVENEKDIKNKEFVIDKNISSLNKVITGMKQKVYLIISKGYNIILTDIDKNSYTFKGSKTEEKIYNDTQLLINRFTNANKIEIKKIN